MYACLCTQFYPFSNKMMYIPAVKGPFYSISCPSQQAEIDVDEFLSIVSFWYRASEAGLHYITTLLLLFHQVSSSVSGQTELLPHGKLVTPSVYLLCISFSEDSSWKIRHCLSGMTFTERHRLICDFMVIKLKMPVITPMVPFPFPVNASRRLFLERPVNKSKIEKWSS